MENFILLLKAPFAALVGGYIVLMSLISIFQSNLIYFPSTDIKANPQSIGLEFESVIFESMDKTKLHAWYVPKKDANATLLFLHGNGGNISHRLDSIKIFNSLGMNVFIFDYRGYGHSQGSSNEQNTYDDAKSAWDYLLKNKKVKAEDIIIFGRSLGGAIAANLGEKVQAKGIILESTFTSAKELASNFYPFFPEFLIRFDYETTKYLKSINYPTLVVHSEDDRLIPFKHGEAIFKNANEPKSFVKIRGDHNSGFLRSSDTYLPALKKFLDECDG